ncbi:hypothetical protein K502DRAFT_349811 [Neoconidiobolus thromboides FSU 785]|nr:hypothetical protein K502DRAFT_349811 [Neoconidiobolus thromboides FSU 785]
MYKEYSYYDDEVSFCCGSLGEEYMKARNEQKAPGIRFRYDDIAIESCEDKYIPRPVFEALTKYTGNFDILTNTFRTWSQNNKIKDIKSVNGSSGCDIKEMEDRTKEISDLVMEKQDLMEANQRLSRNLKEMQAEIEQKDIQLYEKEIEVEKTQVDVQHTCKATLVYGLNKGKRCSFRYKQGSKYCGKHIPTETSINKKKAIGCYNKLSGKAYTTRSYRHMDEVVDFYNNCLRMNLNGIKLIREVSSRKYNIHNIDVDDIIEKVEPYWYDIERLDMRTMVDGYLCFYENLRFVTLNEVARITGQPESSFMTLKKREA